MIPAVRHTSVFVTFKYQKHQEQKKVLKHVRPCVQSPTVREDGRGVMVDLYV